ncbi:MAG: hypothetical protein Q8N81_02715 [bacterium]|nr:hypothetical protein [bacterium]
MPTQKYKNRNIRKLTKVGGGSLSVTLPADLVSQLRWKERQKVKVVKIGRKLAISDWRKPSHRRRT